MAVSTFLRDQRLAHYRGTQPPAVYHILATCVAESATLERELVFKVEPFAEC